MNADVLKASGIDYDAGLARFVNDQELYETVLQAFLHEDCLQRAETAYAANDNQALFKVAHEVKGCSGNADMKRLYVASCRLVELVRHMEGSQEEIDQAYTVFVKAYNEAVEGIRKAME